MNITKGQISTTGSMLSQGKCLSVVPLQCIRKEYCRQVGPRQSLSLEVIASLKVKLSLRVT